ncbi:response regulator [Neolewinella persica]|uniref:response regulator n=1 Tax=Neolewinella persica TaxID=70998 RepID=UPI00036D7361|nr:response regulator [Neolewinella persica]
MIKEPSVPGHARSVRRYVLIVEKDTLQGHLLKVSLQDAGWVVRLADGPQEALRFCEHDLFDVAIINYHYPGGVNGFVLAEHFRRQYHLPSLMITASRYTELTTCGAFTANQDLLFKPYRLFECSRRLERLIDNVPLLCEHQLGVGI